MFFMGNNITLFVNTAFITSCIAMAIVFLAIPLPPNKGLSKYRISLRFLAGAYLIVGLLKIAILMFQLATVDLISIERLTISSLQATLFTLVLITLINPHFITRRFLFYQIIPVLILNILYILVASRYGNPVIANINSLIEQAYYPSVLVRELFVLFYVIQILYLSRLFIIHARKYEHEIDNYFSEPYRLYLPWVRYCYYAALSVGISALVSCFIQSETVVLIFNIVYSIFYLVFGICYIQYPRTFIFIEPAIYPRGSNANEISKNSKRLSWNELKEIILNERYYLRPEVNIEEMARHLKIGRTTLSKFINMEENMNFNGWINSLRIEEAKNLLIQQPNLNLIEISELVGYSESSNFSRQFKLITNESPSVWRLNFKIRHSTLHIQKNGSEEMNQSDLHT